MAKAVLVMDMPGSCFQCRFLHIDTEHVEVIESCGALEVGRQLDTESYDKPEWCPLRELPEKKEEIELRECKGSVEGTWNVPLIENKGFNACLDEILN